MNPEDKRSDERQTREAEGFYRRWSERKLAAEQPLVSDEPTPELPPPCELCDEDMPALETLNETSDYSGFLSPRVSESLRQLALRKLFHSSGFNVCDGLDDYAEDFTQFEALGEVITADLRHQLEQQARRQQAQLDAAEAQVTEQSQETIETGLDETDEQASENSAEALLAADRGSEGHNDECNERIE